MAPFLRCPALLILTLASLLGASSVAAQSPATEAARALDPAPLEWQRPAGLTPFVGTYAAYYRGKPAGDATLTLKHLSGNRWEVVMDVRGNRGVISVLGLNLIQTTVFELLPGDQYRPLTQTTVRKGLFMGKSLSGRYDWNKATAHWEGNIDKKRRAPVALQAGDLSALLINLAVVRDAQPGIRLDYRFADAGRTRLYSYQAAESTATLAVQDLSYDALHLWRTNVRDGNAMAFWIAHGVPTPIRIAQQENGQPGIDLQLIQYEGG